MRIESNCRKSCKFIKFNLELKPIASGRAAQPETTQLTLFLSSSPGFFLRFVFFSLKFDLQFVIFIFSTLCFFYFSSRMICRLSSYYNQTFLSSCSTCDSMSHKNPVGVLTNNRGMWTNCPLELDRIMLINVDCTKKKKKCDQMMFPTKFSRGCKKD